MKASSILTAVTRWLRAGYPDGAPRRGYIPLVALMPGPMARGDIDASADELARSDGPVSADMIRAAASARLHGQPLDADVIRISARLTEMSGPSFS